MQDKRNFFSIRSKLIFIFFAVILTIVTNSISMYISISDIEKAHSKVTDSIYNLNDLLTQKKNIDKIVELFAETKDRDYIDKLYGQIQDFEEDLINISKIKFTLNTQMYLENVKNLYSDSYKKNVDELIYSIRVGDRKRVVQNYKEVIKVSSYAEIYIEKSIKNRIVESQKINKEISEKSQFILRNNIFTMAIMIIFLGFIIFVNGVPLINKISSLVYAAEKVSDGDFEIELLSEKGNDEIKLLNIAFNKLIKNTSRLIEQIKTNANLEIELHKKDAEGHKVEALLNEAELLGLQSQINPHFLFNTLNIIAKTAIIEDAEKTCELIETVSDMFRYNLRKLGEKSTLREEINNIQNYFTIQKNRFGKRFHYSIEIKEELMSFEIPFLTLQPIVENAFIHGIEPLEIGGEISINVKNEDLKTLITIKDNGIGMSEKRINELMNSFEGDNLGHTTGIGFSNVKRRLEIFYGDRLTLNISSVVGYGTEFNIIIKD
ncbi:sensor histidine kinase [Helicovermis profundi]|uniref:histidine kinase n=1 Tax=Helicovermis profundi TaxID=3065157 RepID=A0AAU9E2Y9_9FIRM|nr:hypothetical protein HLPR_12450 [Clostridia bacterium S502]